MLTLQVVRWRPDTAWNANLAWSRNTLVLLIRQALPLTKTQAKHVVKQLLSKQPMELTLPESSPFEAIRHHLESLGAEVGLQHAAQRTVHADGPAST